MMRSASRTVEVRDGRIQCHVAGDGASTEDAILEVDNKKVETAAEFETAIQGVKDAGRATALVKAERDGKVRFLGLPLEATQN